MPIGVYDHPPSADAPGSIGAIQLAEQGEELGSIDGPGLRALETTTTLVDWLHRRVGDLLSGIG